MAAKTYGGSRWCDAAAKIPVNQGTNGRVCVFGAYDPHGDGLYTQVYRAKTSLEFIDFVGRLREAYGGHGRIDLILDNASIHRSRRSREALEGLEGVNLVFLPVNAYKLNRIEAVWSLMQREAINNRHFGDAEELEAACTQWTSYYNGRRRGLLPKHKILDKDK